MQVRRSALLVALVLVSPLAASPQEATAPLDAALVVAGPTERMDLVADIDGDGWPDAVGSYFRGDHYNDLDVFVFHNDGAGGFTSSLFDNYSDHNFNWDEDRSHLALTEPYPDGNRNLVVTMQGRMLR